MRLDMQMPEHLWQNILETRDGKRIFLLAAADMAKGPVGGEPLTVTSSHKFGNGPDGLLRVSGAPQRTTQGGT